MEGFMKKKLKTK